jgi:hypothetical protein
MLDKHFYIHARMHTRASHHLYMHACAHVPLTTCTCTLLHTCFSPHTRIVSCFHLAMITAYIHTYMHMNGNDACQSSCKLDLHTDIIHTYTYHIDSNAPPASTLSLRQTYIHTYIHTYAYHIANHAPPASTSTFPKTLTHTYMHAHTAAHRTSRQPPGAARLDSA